MSILKEKRVSWVPRYHTFLLETFGINPPHSAVALISLWFTFF